MSKVVARPHDPGGFDRDVALTLVQAVAGSSAQMKGRALGIYEPSRSMRGVRRLSQCIM